MDFLSALNTRATGILPKTLNRNSAGEVDRRYDFLEPQAGGKHSGVVWKARDTIRDTTVAVRLFRPRNDACTPRTSVSLQRSLHPTLHLNHPNIVKTHEVRELGNHAWLVATDFVEGPTLSHFVEQNRRFGVNQMLDILIAIGFALDTAHGLGIIRQHLAPGQIVFPTIDHPVLVDWGLTIRPDVRVSAHCLAPETPPNVGPHTDVYLLGVIAYLLATGTSPFSGTSFVEVLQEQLRDRVLSAREHNPSIPQAFDTFLRHTVRRYPTDRYASMVKAVNALQSIRREIDETPTGRRVRIWSLRRSTLDGAVSELL